MLQWILSFCLFLVFLNAYQQGSLMVFLEQRKFGWVAMVEIDHQIVELLVLGKQSNPAWMFYGRQEHQLCAHQQCKVVQGISSSSCCEEMDTTMVLSTSTIKAFQQVAADFVSGGQKSRVEFINAQRVEVQAWVLELDVKGELDTYNGYFFMGYHHVHDEYYLQEMEKEPSDAVGIEGSELLLAMGDDRSPIITVNSMQAVANSSTKLFDLPPDIFAWLIAQLEESYSCTYTPPTNALHCSEHPTFTSTLSLILNTGELALYFPVEDLITQLDDVFFLLVGMASSDSLFIYPNFASFYSVILYHHELSYVLIPHQFEQEDVQDPILAQQIQIQEQVSQDQDQIQQLSNQMVEKNDFTSEQRKQSGEIEQKSSLTQLSASKIQTTEQEGTGKRYLLFIFLVVGLVFWLFRLRKGEKKQKNAYIPGSQLEQSEEIKWNN